MQGNINIPDSTITTNLTFRQLVLMNMQQLTNFPYIEKDFDALTDYELLCLVVKYLNDVIANQNEQNDSITRMYESFLALQDYVNNTKDEVEDAFNELDDYVRNYFDNLNVQDEIDDKLNRMVEDGTLDSIIAQYVNLLKCYSTVTEMIADTELNVNDKVIVIGYSSTNDNGNSFYIIRDTLPSGTSVELSNGLYAELCGNEIYNVLQQPQTSNYQLTAGTKLTGNKHITINANTEDIAVEVKDQNVTIDNVRITNTNSLANKIGIKAYKQSGNTAGLSINNTSIASGFENGVILDGAYFSSFYNLSIGNTTGASLTLTDSQSNWTGDQNFVNCNFNSGYPTVLIDKADTNTISFDNCCFENITDNVIENKGKIYINRSYFGDMVNSGNQTHLLKGFTNSETHFNDCTLALNPVLNNDNSFNTYFDLNNSKVYIDGGLIYAGNRFHPSAIYSSNNENDLIYIDNLKQFEATNWTPYYLYSYSPLRSKNPIKNYIINGTLTDTVQNYVGMETNATTTKDFTINATYVNPFGGKVIEHTQVGEWNPYVMYYEIPDKYVGKPMILQAYGYCRGTSGVPFIVSSSDISTNSSLNNNLSMEAFNPYRDNTEFTERNVFANEIVVYPKSNKGRILIRYQDAGQGFFSISGLALVDTQYSKQMGTFEITNKRACDHKPIYTAEAKKGDIVYNFATTPTCLGWIFDGTAWQDYHSFS